jgi:hypothetical protein
LNLKEQERLEHHAKLIKELILGGDAGFTSHLLHVLECGAALKGRPFFPRIKTLVMEVGWMKIPGTHLVLAHLLSVSVQYLTLEFYQFPKSALVHRYLDIIISKATHLTDLTLQCVVKSGASAPHRDALKDYYISDYSCQLLGQLLSLTSLTLSPKFVTIALLDAIGALPQNRLNYL